MTQSPAKTATAPQGPNTYPENEVHKRIRGILSKRQQGQVMGVLRDLGMLYNPRDAKTSTTAAAEPAAFPVELSPEQEEQFSKWVGVERMTPWARSIARLALLLNSTDRGLIDYAAAQHFARELMARTAHASAPVAEPETMEEIHRRERERAPWVLPKDPTLPGSAPVAGEAQPAIILKALDEYGPRLDWTKHWAEYPVGTKFYAVPQGA